MHRSRSPGMHRAARAVLITSIVANLSSAIAVPALTPSDWEHGLAHIASIGLTAGGLALAW